MKRSLLSTGLFAAGLALAGPAVFIGWPAAEARSHSDIAWPLKDVFNMAVRFIRVDRGCKITDRDPEAAYVTFDCDGDGKDKDKDKAKHGALELIAADVQGRPGVRAQVTLSDEPHYIEQRFLELLERKIRDERGPGLPPLRVPAAPPPDGGR